jgi:hypothetical protein
MSDIHALLERVLENCSDRLSEEDQEALHDLAQTYEPYAGDDPEEAASRDLGNALCRNCDFTFPAMAMPAEVSKVAKSAARHAACPRCFSNEEIFLTATTTAY